MCLSHAALTPLEIILWSLRCLNSSTISSVRGAPWTAANRLHGQRTRAFSWRPVLRPFQEDRPIPARPYPGLCNWMVVLAVVISVFTLHSEHAQAPPDMQPTPPGFYQHAYQPPPPSMLPPLPRLTTPIHQL